MKLKINDKIVDYAAAIKSLGIAYEHKPHIPYHIVTLTIDDWPIEFVNSVRFILLKMYPVKRLEAKVTTTDVKMIIDNVVGRIRQLIIDSSCRTGSFEYELTHTLPYEEPLNVTFEDSEIGKYINRSLITVIDKGRTIKVTGEIVQSTALDMNHAAYNFCTIFARPVKEFDEYERDGVFWNKGKIQFRYQDSAPAKEVLKNVFNIFLDIIKDIKAHLDQYLLDSVDIPYLIVPKDRSAIIARCIKRYIYHENRTFIIQTGEAEDVSMAAKITFRGITRANIKPIIITAIDKLVKDILTLG